MVVVHDCEPGRYTGLRSAKLKLSESADCRSPFLVVTGYTELRPCQGRKGYVSGSPYPVKVCQSCPFRRSNMGKRVPKGIYTETNLWRLWRGLSEGERLACFEQETLSSVQECGASLLLVARHLNLLSASEDKYAELALTPLTPRGVSRWISRLASRAEVACLDGLMSMREVYLPAAESPIGVPWACPVTNGRSTESGEDFLS